MTTAPGWYDAGTPGRVRWWDGTQWTEHERDAAAPAPAAGSSATPAAPVGSGPLPGWYPTEAGPARWWDGTQWTGFRTKDGKPHTDWAMTEQITVSSTLGAVFLFLGLAQVGLHSLGSNTPLAGFPMLLLAALMFGTAIQASIVQRIPRPTAAPVLADVFRPLPGEQEGVGAGWYPVSGTTTRWWTGTRWSQYAGTKFGIRPTFHGAKALARLRWVWIATFAIAAIGVVAGIALIIVGSTHESDYITAVIGWIIAIAGVVFAGLGVAIIAMARYQARMLLLPEHPPRV